MSHTQKNRFLGPLMFLLAVVLVAAAVVPESSAQGTRRKRKPSRTTVVPVTQPGDAQIISRAGDFPDTETVPVQRVEPARTGDPAWDQSENARALDDIRNRIAGLESMKKGDPDERQKRLLLNLDILNRAEQRSESLRKQLFEMMEKESNIKAKLDMIETNLRPEAIDREVAFAGTLRPEDLRAMKKKQLEVERANLQNILNEIQKTRTVLDLNLQRSEQMVEKLRLKLDKEVDDALTDDPNKP